MTFRRRRAAAGRRRPIVLIVSMASLAVAVTAWEAVAFWLFPGPSIVSGRVLDGNSVVDGDTLRIAGQRIRLYGIDAPELDQTCANGWPAGQEARRALAGIVTTRALDCRYVTTDIYRRAVAICRVDGEDLSEALIRSGMGWAYRTQSLRYLFPEWQAWFDDLGVHAHPCISPSAWRRSR